jgi:hypothetical protein
MEHFSLDKWLKDKSRKVVTRDGRTVRIICWDAKSSQPIVALVSTRSINQRQFDELPISYFNDGTYYGGATEDFLDLFFADDEEKLTEFEKKLKEVLYEHATTNTSSEEKARQYAPELLDLARKELEKSIEDGAIEFAKSYMEDVNPSFEKVQESEELWKWKMSCLRGINKAYSQGKRDALKDLPKWKKSPYAIQYHYHSEKPFLGTYEDGRQMLTYKDYEIDINKLFKKLPKEE